MSPYKLTIGQLSSAHENVSSGFRAVIFSNRIAFVIVGTADILKTCRHRECQDQILARARALPTSRVRIAVMLVLLMTNGVL
jgi:hypothetical protein